MHTGLPVAGYVSQTDEKIAVVNVNKELEERVLRQIDEMESKRNTTSYLGDESRFCVVETSHVFDVRMMAIAKTKIQEGFMWLNRAVFQPTRVSLPEDGIA